MWTCTVHPLWSRLHYITTGFISHMVSQMPSKEMLLDMLIQLLLLFLLPFHARSQANCWTKEQLMRWALTKRWKRLEKWEGYNGKVLLGKIQLTSFGLSDYLHVYVQQGSSLICTPQSRSSHFNGNSAKVPRTELTVSHDKCLDYASTQQTIFPRVWCEGC